MTITLPDEWRERLEILAKSRGFATIDECLLDLLQDLDRDAEALPESSEVIDSQLTPRNRLELESMLDEGMKSGGIVEADEAFWAERRRVCFTRGGIQTASSDNGIAPRS